MTDRTFTVAEARALIPEVREHVAEIISTRADLAELARDLREGKPSEGGIPEAKAYEARLDELVTWFTDNGIAIRGLAPVLIDFPSTLNGDDVQLCWLEGEPDLSWYHSPDLGFVGRRPIPED